MQRTESQYATSTQLYTTDIPLPAISADALTSIQEEIANTVESRGLVLNENDNTQLAQAINVGNEFATEVTTQTEFDAVFERTAANEYKILDEIKSLVIKMETVTFPLNVADTKATISTNFCKKIICFPTCTIETGDIQYILNINTDDCYVDGIVFEGDQVAQITLTADISIFDINADNVILKNCIVQTYDFDCGAFELIIFDGNSNKCIIENCNVNTIDIEGTDAAPHDQVCFGNNTADSSLFNCYVEGINVSSKINFIGFQNLFNGENMQFLAVEFSTTTGNLIGFDMCLHFTNCVSEIPTTTAIGNNSASYNVSGFKSCKYLINCESDIANTNDVLCTIKHIDSCEYIVNAICTNGRCRRQTDFVLDSKYITNISLSGLDTADSQVAESYYGLNTCNNITNVYVGNISTSGIAKRIYCVIDSNFITNIQIELITADENIYGIKTSNHIACLSMTTSTAAGIGKGMYGFDGCFFGSCMLFDGLASAVAIHYTINLSEYISSTLIQNSTGGLKYGMKSCQHICSTEIINSNFSNSCNYADDDDDVFGHITKEFSCQGF